MKQENIREWAFFAVEASVAIGSFYMIYRAFNRTDTHATRMALAKRMEDYAQARAVKWANVADSARKQYESLRDVTA